MAVSTCTNCFIMNKALHFAGTMFLYLVYSHNRVLSDLCTVDCRGEFLNFLS